MLPFGVEAFEGYSTCLYTVKAEVQFLGMPAKQKQKTLQKLGEGRSPIVSAERNTIPAAAAHR